MQKTNTMIPDLPDQPKLLNSFKVRLSFSRRDLSLLPIFREMAVMQSEHERREYLRGILYRSIVAAPASANAVERAPGRHQTTKHPALSPTGRLATAQEVDHAAATPTATKVVKNFTEEKAKAMRMLGLGD